MIPSHQTRTLFKSDLLRVIDYRCSGQDGGTPQEDYAASHEIILPRSGAYLTRSAAGEHLVDPNQALFFNRGQGYQVTHPLPGGDRSTVFLLRSDVLIELLAAARQEVHSERPFTRYHVILDSRLRLAQYWLLQPGESNQAEALQVEENLLMMLGELLSGLEGQAGRSNGPANSHAGQAARDLAERVKLLLGGRFQESIRLDEIARAVYTSPFHLCRSFKRATGLSIHRYLTRLRLHQALEDLLDQPDAPLSLIALDLGFASHNHFTSAFRAEFGLTPGAFRQAASSRQVRQMRNFLKA
jgi:AraC family transcriptional regulator